MDSKTLLTVGALGIVGYLLYKAFSGVAAGAQAVGSAVASGYQGTVNALASGLLTLFGPPDMQGPNTYYIVQFPDGSQHAVGADQVDANGLFNWSGYPPGSSAQYTYQLAKDSNGHWYAVG